MQRAAPFSIALLLSAGLPGSLFSDVLGEITRPVEGKSRRASSGLYDPESNQDASHIGPGETQVLAELPGPGEIRHVWFTAAGRDRRWPRLAVLRIFWDGARAPSVETPLGDFFAAGHGMRAEVNSLPIQATSYGRALNSYWRMPFRKTARIEVENQGRHDLCLYWQVDWMELPRAPESMLYFHARYRQEFPAKAFSPYVIFDGKGSGQYVGTVLSIHAAVGSWFGESDDRFFIDGEEEASIVGTGTEDYFNDAWNLRLFSNANTGVTIKEPNGEDCRFTGFRWHIQAPVTFRKSLRVEIERRSFCQVADPRTGARREYDFKYRPDFMSSVAFWYQVEPAEADGPLARAEERVIPEIVLETADLVPRIKASEGLAVARKSNRVCQEKRVLSVENGRPGAWLEVPCRVDEPGRWAVSIFQCLFRTGGIWKATLRGPAGESVLDPALDFFDPYLAWKENRPENYLYGTWNEAKVGIHRLEPGDYVFRFECVGSNPLSRADGSAAPGHDARIDGISLRRLPWEEPHLWMARYLAEEEKLFAARVAEARGCVEKIAGAIERFRKETGGFPRSLEELLAAPPGTRPFLDRLPRDPWGQGYRYDFPGRFLPDRFDVYSVHGNSRAPGSWIGNWPSPYRIPEALEGEDLKVLGASPGASASVQELNLNAIPPLSGGKLLFIRFPGEGAWVDLGLPEQAGGRPREMALRLVTSWDYGIVRLRRNGEILGEPVDGFSQKIGTRTVRVPAPALRGQRALRIESAGRAGGSAGYCAGLDAIVLR